MSLLSTPRDRTSVFAERYTACPVCYSTRLSPDFSLPSHTGVQLHWDRCAICGFTFMNPRLVRDEMYKVYLTREYWTDHAYSDYVQGEPVRLENALRRLDPYASDMPRSGKLLDLACATGSFGAAAARRGYQVTGVDMNEEMIEFGRRTYGLDLRAAVIEDCEFAPESFDAISMWGLDCHFYDFRSAFQKITGWLKCGGSILFGYQDYGHWIRWFFPKIKQDANVYYNFTQDSLARFVSQLGLRIVRNETGFQVTQLHRITRSLKAGRGLFSRLDHVRLAVPTPSYMVAIFRKLDS